MTQRKKLQISRWRWIEVVAGIWELYSPSEKGAATVWRNGMWRTWDRMGNGGENSQEKTVAEAKRQAFAAVAMQGHHEIQITDETAEQPKP